MKSLTRFVSPLLFVVVLFYGIAALPVHAAVFNLSGQVTLSSGGGVVGATVNVINPSDGSIIVSTATDSSGSYFVAVSGGAYNIGVVPPMGSGYGAVTFLNKIISSDTVLNFVLAPASSNVTLTGRLLDPLGNAVPGVPVSLGDRSGVTLNSTTTTTGNYSFTFGPKDVYLSIPERKDFNPALAVPSVYTLQGNGNFFSVTQDTVVDIVLPSKRVSVHVQDGTGNPVSGAAVSADNWYIWNCNLTIGPTAACGRSSFPSYLSQVSTNASGDATLWLFPSPSTGSNNFYAVTVNPPSGSVYAPFILNNVAVAGDQTEVISLQFVHAPPVTTITLSPAANSQGNYPDPTTVTLSAVAASGFTIANTYYTLDGSSQQTYEAPFAVVGNGSHTLTFWSVDNIGIFEAANTLTFAIAPLSISTTTLPATTVSAAYSQTVQAMDGIAPLRWNVSLGSLPLGLSLNSSTGAIAGIPTMAGSYDFTVWVTDANSQIATQDLTIIVNPAPTINTTLLPDATVGAGYSQTISATGGTTPLTWSISAGTLPSELSLNSSTGELSGSPTAADTSTFTIQAVDANEVSDSQELSLTVNPTPAITTTSLAVGIVGATYSQMVAVLGGTTPFIWTVSSGSLPTGLSLNSATGEISGTPSATSTSSFTVQVTDANGATASQALSITVQPALSITTNGQLADATINAAYSQTMSASGGTPPITWGIASGSLPPGLSLAILTGTISGTPTISGTYNFTVQVTDSSSQTATAAQSITVNPAPVIATTSLPDATVSGSYSQTLAVSGGTVPFAWGLASGAMPTGLSLSLSGVISGMPTVAGTFSFTVRVSDNYGASASQVLSIVVHTAPVIARNNLPDKKLGKHYSQTLNTVGGTLPLTWSIASGSLPAGLAIDPSTGVISGMPATVGIFTFTVQVTDANSVNTSKGFSIEIKL